MEKIFETFYRTLENLEKYEDIFGIYFRLVIIYIRGKTGDHALRSSVLRFCNSENLLTFTKTFKEKLHFVLNSRFKHILINLGKIFWNSKFSFC